MKKSLMMLSLISAIAVLGLSACNKKATTTTCHRHRQRVKPKTPHRPP